MWKPFQAAGLRKASKGLEEAPVVFRGELTPWGVLQILRLGRATRPEVFLGSASVPLSPSGCPNPVSHQGSVKPLPCRLLPACSTIIEPKGRSLGHIGTEGHAGENGTIVGPSAIKTVRFVTDSAFCLPLVA